MSRENLSNDDQIALYGLDKELAEKAALKYDPKREQEAAEYISLVANKPFPSDVSFHEALKDGILLSEMINQILLQTPSVDAKQIKISLSKMPFKQMENIGAFLDRIEKLGVPAHERFMTVDLFEAKNMNQVVNCIFSISRHAHKQGFQGPILGPKLTEKNERTFSEEQLLEARALPSKLMSFSTSVSSGLTFSYRREIGERQNNRASQESISGATSDGGPTQGDDSGDKFRTPKESVVNEPLAPQRESKIISDPVHKPVEAFQETVKAKEAPEAIIDSVTAPAKVEAPLPEIPQNVESNVDSVEETPKSIDVQTDTQKAASTLSITQFKTYAEYKKAKAALEAENKSTNATSFQIQTSEAPAGSERRPLTSRPARGDSLSKTRAKDDEGENECVIIDE